ncbi:PAAR-like protein [Chryseobacterium echinoideorum]|uniref:PAAR-like protein n=1 Tax=Chryseobacterium echinoideorum TaxID=1549648 RepID=UPI00118504F0|nr:PAAR-like protein [Chryseobacterium echinoideorum]
MAEPIPYIIKSGDTYSSIAKKLGLKDWIKLKSYHNECAGFNHQVGNTLYANTELLTPSPEDVAIMNGDAQPPKDEVKEEQQQEEQKQQEENKKQEEKKKQEQIAKGEHDGKYFVVHGAKCVCDKAENPKQTADFQVTSHKIIVLNDQSKKYLATEDDKTFMPPVATFGKCTLKPSSGGYLPCALAPAPKWDKAYESTQVQGKKSLTEISELKCMVGGKITIEKHGQTDSVTTAHADNTNPLELAMVNPAVEQPKKKTDYPSVSSISINQIGNRQNFKPKNSKIDKAEFSVIYLRKGEEAMFEAQLSKGNKQLTSWVVYNDHEGSKENRILVRAQIGTEFSQSFEQYGKYRVEGYGKPKSPDFENGKYDKCDPSCSIDIEVIENVLYDLECVTDSFSNRLDANKKLKFRQNFPVSFNAKFRMPRNLEEKSRLRMYALDAAGNVLTDAVAQGVSLTLIPQNSKAIYTIVAEYTTESGEIITKQLIGETESNTVVGISHSAEVVRPGTSLQFHVEKMRYDFNTAIPELDISPNEINEIKWNLNGIQIGTGRSITIPGNMLLTPQKYVVEAFCKMANAFGSKAKHEEDDWHFEVKHNDIISYQKNGPLKVGKSIRFSIGNNDLIFKNLASNEQIYWNLGGKTFQGHYVDYTPTISGVLSVRCYINSQKGIIKSEPIVEAKITEGFWNDFGGSEVSRARWGQTVDYCIKGENIEGEKIELHIYDDDNPPNDDDFAYSNIENNLQITGKANDSYAYHRIELSDKIKERTTNIASDEVKLYAKAKLIGFNTSLTDVTEKKDTQKHLTVNNEEEVYRAIIGDKDGRARHNPVDYDIISWVYANTTYPKDTKLKVKIFEDKDWAIDPDCKELEVTEAVKEDGTLVAEINWGKLKDAKQNKKTKKYYAVIYDKDDNKLLDGSDSDTICSTVLMPQSELNKEASYVGAVTVGSDTIQQPDNQNGVCEQEARVRAYMRMLRVGEGTGELIKSSEYNKKTKKTEIVYIAHDFESGYTKLFGGDNFTKSPHNKDMSSHPQIKVLWYTKKNGEKVYSSAAGAYQVMGYTWSDNDMINKRKTYSVKDFSPEGQDKFCIVLFKHKREGMLDLIIKGEIKGATEKYGSYEWASLPPGRYGQPIETMEKALELYDKFYKEELTGKSPLHLKKGFLKEFGYSCCDGQSTPSVGTGSCDKCHQNHYDVSKPEHWIHQKPSECWQASIDILANYGLKNNSGYPQNRIIMADQTGTTLIPKDTQKALDYLDSQLKLGNPIVVGLDDNLRKATYNSHKATEHFFVIVGKGCEEGKIYYRFFDVGSPTKDQGTSETLKLYLQGDNLLQGKSYGGSHTYTVTEVRRNN